MADLPTTLPDALAAAPPRDAAAVMPLLATIEQREATLTRAFAVAGVVLFAFAVFLVVRGGVENAIVPLFLSVLGAAVFAFSVRALRREHGMVVRAVLQTPVMPAQIVDVIHHYSGGKHASYEWHLSIRAASEPVTARVILSSTKPRVGVGAAVWLFPAERRRGLAWVPTLGLVLCELSPAKP